MQPHYVFFGEEDALKRLPPTDEEKLLKVSRDNPSSPFSRFIGNDKAVRKLQVAAYKALGDPTHMMRDLSFAIFGPASAGKTTLARIYADVVKLPFVEISPKGVKNVNDVFDLINSVLTNHGIGLVEDVSRNYCLPPTVIFIDEVHAIPDGIIQGLLKATEFNDSLMMTENGRVLNTFAATWIIATTDEGKLFDAFRTRFSPVHLQYLPKSDIAKIVKKANPDLSDEVCIIVASYNPRVPRKALEFARYMQMYKQMHVDKSWEDVARSVANDEGINEYGFHELEVKVLNCLKAGPVAKKTLCSLVGRKEEELERFIVPVLMAETSDQPSLITVTSRGYKLTDVGMLKVMEMDLDDESDKCSPNISIYETLKYLILKVPYDQRERVYTEVVTDLRKQFLSDLKDLT